MFRATWLVQHSPSQPTGVQQLFLEERRAAPEAAQPIALARVSATDAKAQSGGCSGGVRMPVVQVGVVRVAVRHRRVPVDMDVRFL